MLIMSIKTLVTTCKNCGAPLDGYICPYCDSYFGPPQGLNNNLKVGYNSAPDGLLEIAFADRKYRVLGQLAKGAHSTVLLARRAGLLTEQVVLKVSDRAEVLQREWRTLRHLEGRCSYLDRLLPRPVAHGKVGGRCVLAYRWRSGFVHTLALAKKQYPEGVPAVACVWMWNRILDQLMSLHHLGYSHGNIKLENLLVHPRDHGIAFCGWSQARLGEGADLEQSGRCIAQLLGPNAPRPLLKLARQAGEYASACRLQDQLQRVAEAVLGPPRFIPFALPRVPNGASGRTE